MEEDRPVYSVEHEIEQDHGNGSERVRLHDSIGGSVFQCHTYTNPALTEPFEKYVGWTYALGVTFAPDPERLVGFMEKIEVPIKFVDERDPFFGHIPPDTYGAILLEGFHPVSVNNKFYYLHDISSDHLPAVLIGGKRVIEIISSSTAPARHLSVASLAKRYDLVTEILSASLTQTLSARMRNRSVSGPLINDTNREAIIRYWGSGGVAACAELERVLEEGLERLELL